MAPAKKTEPDDESPKAGARRKGSARRAAKAPAAAEKPAKRTRVGEPARASEPARGRGRRPRGPATPAPAAASTPPPAPPTAVPAPAPAAAPRAAAPPRPVAGPPPPPPSPPRAPAPSLPFTPGPVAASSAPPGPPAPSARVIPPLPDDEHDPEPFDGPEDDDAVGEGAPGAEQGLSAAGLLEAVRRGERHVSALDALGDEEVGALAAAQGWRPRPGERRSETLFRLLQGRAAEQVPETAFAEGLLELHPDGYGFLRTPKRHYAQHPHDVYVPAGLVRRLHLKPGHWVGGQAHRARPGEPFFALHEVEEVNHDDPARLAGLKRFEELTVVYPDTRYVLEVNPEDIEMRLMDLFCPLGRGQRGLIVAPPRTGKTILLQKLADAIAHNAPNADIVVLLVDERPEEVTNLRRSVRGEVIASTFDKPVANHVRVAELVIEKVKRMVELGRHVVLLLDSITRLGRAYNNLAPTTGRILSGGMDAGALTKPKLFFASARNVEDGGSLTILATALVDTGSRLDTLVFEEFKGSGNMEVVLDRDLANQRIWPAINIPASGTRNEDLLLHPDELRRITRLRRAISDHAPADALVMLRDMLKQHKTNAEVLMTIE